MVRLYCIIKVINWIFGCLVNRIQNWNIVSFLRVINTCSLSMRVFTFNCVFFRTSAKIPWCTKCTFNIVKLIMLMFYIYWFFISKIHERSLERLSVLSYISYKKSCIINSYITFSFHIYMIYRKTDIVLFWFWENNFEKRL